jgi:hypothetical protein
MKRVINKRGVLLTEVLVVTAILAILIPALGQLYWAILRGRGDPLNRLKADYLALEYLEGAKIIKGRGWENLVDGNFSLSYSTGRWELVADPATETVDGFERSLSIEPVYRDLLGGIVESGGFEDRNSKIVEARVRWRNPSGDQERSEEVLLTRLDNEIWTESLKSEFDQGVRDFVIVDENDDGEFLLAGGCEPSNPPVPNIFEDSFVNGWREPLFNWPPAKVYKNQTPAYLGNYSFRIKYPSDESWTYLINWSGVCTRGFRKIKFWAYNSSTTSQSFKMGTVLGNWSTRFSLPPLEWTEVVIPYLEINNGSHDNIWNIYTVIDGSSSEVNVYYDEMLLIEGTGGFYNEGTFVSRLVDIGEETVFNRMFWEAEVPEGSSLGFQLAVADAPEGPFEFLGPGGLLVW